jgi:aspartate/glutamate racemase
MTTNPELFMISVDCAEYAMLLVNKDWQGVRRLLWSRGIVHLVKALERGDIDFIVQASNTSHLALDRAELE